MSDPTIITRDLTKVYRVAAAKGPARTVTALDGVSLTIRAGERVGIVGRNGSGKSTLLKILSRVIYPTAGEASLYGAVTSLLEVGTGFNSELSGRENIYLNAALHGLGRKAAARSVDSIIAFSELKDFIDNPLKTYSSGMRSRLAFSVAAHLDADILMLDEVLAVGDAGFQNKCLARINDMTGATRTLLFVSHSTDAVTRFCNRAVWLDRGRVVEDGPAVAVTRAYMASVADLRPSFHVAPMERRAPGGAPKGRATGAAATGGAAEAEPADPIELVSARMVDADGAACSGGLITQRIGVELVFDILEPNASVEPALMVTSADGVRVFVGAFVHAATPEGFNAPGRYRVTAWIGANLLNVGVYGVSLHLQRPDPLIRYRVHENALSFYMSETAEAKALTRGRYGRNFPGLVRPALTWDVETLPAPALAAEKA